MKKGYFVFILIVALLNSCIKEECQIAGGQYVFEIPASLSPAKDTYRVGDTISISSRFENMVYEFKTDKHYLLDQIKFYPGTEVVKIDSLKGESGIGKYFEIIIDNNINYSFKEFSAGVQLLTGEYNYLNGMYELEFKLIAKSAGLYYLEQGVALAFFSEQDFNGKCPNLGMDGYVKMNEGLDNNIMLLKDSPDPHYNTWILDKPVDRFHQFGGYCFYVVE
jgi:hypothetical protein